MNIISLSGLLKAGGEHEVREYLSSFSCARNNDVESFLHNQAINNEKKSFTRTSIVIDELSGNDVIGYFTLMIKSFDFLENVSGNTKKRLTNNKNETAFTACRDFLDRLKVGDHPTLCHLTLF